MVGRVKKTPRTEQKEGMVYVDQPPRTEWIPSSSPPCLKLETWLRMEKIPYEHIDHESLTGSNNSQLPHCKVGGKEIPYSIHMTTEIANAVSKEAAETNGTTTLTSTPMENGVQRAFEGLIEGSLHWVLIYMRATQANQLPPCDGFQGRLWQFVRPLANKVVASKLKTKADYQGIGRQNASDVLATGKEDLRAISAYLADKNYMGGDMPNKLDATAFAHLSQFFFIPWDNELKAFMKEECPNLVTYIERMKNEFWPDWEEKCRKPTPPRRTKSKDETAAAAVDTEQKAETTAAESTTTNGCAEKEEQVASTNGNETVVVTKVVETVEVVTVPVAEGEAHNGVTEEHKHAGTPNGATTPEKVAE